MRFRGLAVALAVVATGLVVGGCGHRLVAAKGEKTVTVYQSEEIYNAAIAIRKSLERPELVGQQRQYVTLLDSMVRNQESKETEGGTKVSILSRNAAGAQVELLEGPNKGYKGFVPKENLP
jgi:hypothetical protein